MRYFRSLCSALVAAAAVAVASPVEGGSVERPGVTSVSLTGALRVRSLRFGIGGDPQHYFTRDVIGRDQGISKLIAEEMVQGIIAYRPDFMIFDGDLADSAGGQDQNGVAAIADDPNSLGCVAIPKPPACIYADQARELTDFRKYIYDPLVAAGIPVFIVQGNHDSCDDIERVFPASEWMTYSYAYAVRIVSGTCGLAHVDNTLQRAALLDTPIGTVCVVSGTFANGNQDNTWIQGQIGCGGGRPTVVTAHTGATAITPPAIDAAVKADIIGFVNGHFIVQGDGNPAHSAALATMSSQGPAVGYAALRYDVNTQERTFGPYGDSRHTGDSWFSIVEITPSANTSTIRAVNSHRGGRSSADVPGDFFMANSTLTLPFNFCTEFGGPACP